MQKQDAEDPSKPISGEHTNLTVDISLSTLNRSNCPDFTALIGHPLTTDEQVSLITTIFSEYNQPRVGNSLSRANHQTIIDVMDGVSTYVCLSSRDGWVNPLCIFGQALDSLAPHIRRRCLRFLLKTCGQQALLPESILISCSYEPTEGMQYRGGYADVWKGRYHDQDVAMKVLRVHQGRKNAKIIHVGYRRPSASINKLTTSRTRVSVGRSFGSPYKNSTTLAEFFPK